MFPIRNVLHYQVSPHAVVPPPPPHTLGQGGREGEVSSHMMQEGGGRGRAKVQVSMTQIYQQIQKIVAKDGVVVNIDKTSLKPV